MLFVVVVTGWREKETWGLSVPAWGHAVLMVAAQMVMPTSPRGHTSRGSTLWPRVVQELCRDVVMWDGGESQCKLRKGKGRPLPSRRRAIPSTAKEGHGKQVAAGMAAQGEDGEVNKKTHLAQCPPTPLPLYLHTHLALQPPMMMIAWVAGCSFPLRLRWVFGRVGAGLDADRAHVCSGRGDARVVRRPPQCISIFEMICLLSN